MVNKLQVLPFQPEETILNTLALADISIVSLDPGAEGLWCQARHFITWQQFSCNRNMRGKKRFAHSVEICEAGFIAQGIELLASSILSLLEKRLAKSI